MKLLSTFEALSTLTSSGAGAGFPVANVAVIEPMQRWAADAYAGDVWVMNDFGGAKSLTGLFLNRCNFPAARVQGNDTNAWGSPSFDQAISLVLDDAGNRKGWFDLSAFNYRYLRILIASGQTLDNSETKPAIGNLIVGTSVVLPLVADFNPRMVRGVMVFNSDAGGYIETPKGRARHIITIGIGDDLAAIRSMPKSWSIGVVFADLGNAGESWLVYPPNDWDRPIRSVLDAELRFQLREKP